MEDLVGLIVPFLVLLWVVVQILAAIKKAKSEQESGGGIKRQQWTYMADQRQLREFLRQRGIISGEEQRPEEPQQRPVTRIPVTGEEQQQGVIPSAPRSRGRARTVSAQEARAQRHLRQAPAAPAAGSPATRRLLSDSPESIESIDRHLRARRLAEGERTLEPTVEAHILQRHLGETQESLSPTIESHLEASRLAEAARGPAQVRRLIRAPKRGIRRGGAAEAARARTFRIPELDVRGLRQAVVLSEILSPPVAMREGRREF